MSIFLPITALAFLYVLAIFLSKYPDKYNWFFELEHFLGGFFVAMFLSNFLLENRSIIVFVILIGILWEIGESVINKSRKIQQFLINKFNYYIDRETTPGVILDLLLDFLGGVAFLYLFNRYQ